jgi:cof-like hydrolase
MIGFDLDGTLLTTDKILTERTKKALEAAADQGVILVPATGRPLCGLPKELLELPFIKYAVTANGARILETKTEQVLSEMLISVEKAREILDIFSDYDTLRDVYYDGIGYSEKEKLVHIQDYVMTKAMGEYILNTRVPVESVEEKFETENRGTDKVQALFRYQTDKEEAWKRIRKVTGVEATGALENNIEVNAEGVHKGMALLKLGEIFGISREEIAAFGDGSNDTMMLKTVGMGVAMANGMPEVKAAADRLTDSNDEEGVARFIEKYILKTE